jgi:hypothetical protein
MHDCTISIEAPQRILKGAGIPNTPFIPSWIYKINIILKNKGDFPSLCSFSSILGNGIHFSGGLKVQGPDSMLFDAIKLVEPSREIGNDNMIIYGNNFTLSAGSENIISFDISLCDKYTENCTENTGGKIPHESKINFFGHLICSDYVDSCRFISEAADYELNISCEDSSIKPGGTTKYYIHCRTGQYDMVRSVYLRSILDEGLEYIPDSCNIEPRNVYTFENKTILKWDIGSLQPSEVKRIGYRVMFRNSKQLALGDMLKNKVNSNCVNNSTYTQCPSSCEYDLAVE